MEPADLDCIISVLMGGRRDSVLRERFNQVVRLLEACATAPQFLDQHDIEQAHGIGCYRCRARDQCVYVFDNYLVSDYFLELEFWLQGLRRVMRSLQRSKVDGVELPVGWALYLSHFRGPAREKRAVLKLESAQIHGPGSLASAAGSPGTPCRVR